MTASQPFKKQIIIAVSTFTGQFLTTWNNVQFDGFTAELNGGKGEAIIRLALPFDYSGADINVGNDIEIRISDIDTVNGGSQDTTNTKIIYTGYISLVERDIDGAREGITVHVLGYYSLLALDFLKNSTQTTLYSYSTSGLTTTIGSQNAADIGLMMQAVILRYRAENANPRINFNSQDIPLTGTTATYTFKQKTYRDAMDFLKALAPPGTYYYINGSGFVKFKPIATSAVHVFTFGKHFTKVHTENNMETVRNFGLIWNGQSGGSQVYNHYEDDGSISLYGRRADSTNDYGVASSGAADLLGAKFLSENKNPQVKVVVRIMDNNGDPNLGYDIEKIEPGDTVSFNGFAPGLSAVFYDNMIITEVKYTLDYVDVTIELIKSSLFDLTEAQSEAINDIQTGGLDVPTTYS